MSLDEVNKHDFLTALPDEWPNDLLADIREQIKVSRRKIVVLDDDPTGTQTVHGVPVLTEWSVETLRDELQDEGPAFYVLTNSRSLPSGRANALNAEIGRNLVEAGRQASRQFVVISRSDSTLRGHFPGEVEALAGALGQKFDAWLLIPFFLEGGRYTINDVHYVAEGGCLVPAGQTESARDAAFGYWAFNLRQWVEEKTRGRIPSEAVVSITLKELRQDGPDRAAARLCGLRAGSVCVVNAASYRDLEVVTLGLLDAEGKGKRFLYRTAASIVRVRAGITPRPLLTRADLNLPSSGAGLIVVGSHVPRSTSQVELLSALPGVVSIEISVEALLDDRRQAMEIERTTDRIDRALQRGQDVMASTSRKLVAGSDAAASLSVGQRVSSGLVSVVRGLSTRPRYLLAKGGITSSDLATKALTVRRGRVPGQILPGVPVWKLGPESRHPGMAYIVFPGNVGDRRALVEIVSALR